MPYRGPYAQRQTQQVQDVFRYGGYTATWRQYVSASAGNPDLGLGNAACYREQVITALLGVGRASIAGEQQTQAGMIAADELQATTREKLARQDELIWRGVTYRVDSDPMPSRIGPHWITLIKRGE